MRRAGKRHEAIRLTAEGIHQIRAIARALHPPEMIDPGYAQQHLSMARTYATLASVRKDGRGRPSSAAGPAFTSTIVNATSTAPKERQATPSIAVETARKIAAAPVAAQSAIAKAVEEKKLTREQAIQVVEAVKAAPPKRQAEVLRRPLETIVASAKERRVDGGSVAGVMLKRPSVMAIQAALEVV